MNGAAHIPIAGGVLGCVLRNFGAAGCEVIIMPKHLGPIEICCDAPPYYIVRACRRIGIERPEDVRWWRLSHFLRAHANWRQLLLGMNRPDDGNCSCGQKLPCLEWYTFTLSTGTEASYFLGQCSRCHTIFWEKP